MKHIRLFLLATVAFLLLTVASCQKDENGYRITYYKNKKAIGYLFYKFENDSIAPITNFKMKSYSSSGGIGWLFSGKSHTDYVYSDNNGKYVFKLVKRIDNNKVSYYEIIREQTLPITPDYVESSGKSGSFFRKDIENIEIMDFDTAFYHIKQK